MKVHTFLKIALGLAGLMGMLSTASAYILTIGGTPYTQDGVIVEAVDVDGAAGTGFIDSFLRIQAANGKISIEEGYNTSDRDTQFDELTSLNFTRDLLAGDIPRVTIGATTYGVFVLDVNEGNGGTSPAISLDNLLFFHGANQATNTEAGNFDTATSTLGTLSAAFALSETLFLTDVNPGSGRYDFLILTPEAYLGTPTENFYLYARFNGADGGIEEFATLTGCPATQNCTPVPLPATVGLLGIGLVALSSLTRRRTGPRKVRSHPSLVI